MKKVLSLLSIVFLSTLTGCYYDSEEALYPTLSTSCDQTNVTFSGTVKPILQASCLSCHSNSKASSSGGGIRLEAYADVLASVNSGRLMGAVKQTLERLCSHAFRRWKTY
jgi:hypothetical protein